MAELSPRRSLELLEPEQAALSDEIEALTPAQWVQPSNCAGWQIADLATHAARNGESVLLAVQRGMVGDVTPAFGPTMRAREEEIRALGASGCAQLQRREHEELVHLVKGLTDAELNRLSFPHPSGMRSLAWFCHQRLVEVAIHRWDLHRSLGDWRPLEPAALAGYVLEFMLQPGRPSIANRPQAGRREAFRLAAGTVRWTITSDPGGLELAAGETDGQAPLVSAEPGWLVLALYGRTRIDRPEFTISGPPDVAARFASVFGQPES